MSTTTPVNPKVNVSPVSSNYDSSDDAYVDDNCLSLIEQQDKIDKTLNFLKNYPLNKRQRGRPRRGETKSESSTSKPDKPLPDFINDNLKAFTNINELHPGLLLDHLMRINTFNKRLLASYSDLNEKYNELKTVISGSALRETSVSRQSTSSPLCPSTRDNEDKNRDNSEDLIIKIDDLEQKTLENTILFTSENVLTDDSINDVNAEVKKLICNKIPSIDESDISFIKHIDKDKKKVKVICNSVTVKRNIISYARKHKPGGVYFSEFLTNRRDKLHFELRKLKRDYPDKLRVYTREGNVCYKLMKHNKFGIIKSEQHIKDVLNLLSDGQES